jgi:hypothetical protein
VTRFHGGHVARAADRWFSGGGGDGAKGADQGKRESAKHTRQGIRLDRATLGIWAGRACFHLKPVADRMCAYLSAADRLFMDETTAPVAGTPAAVQATLYY